MKQKAGIRILPEYETINKVVSYIITHSNFEIFTENTTSGITLLATLKPDFQENSPCRVSRPCNFDKPIIKFLFKFSLWGEQDGYNRTNSINIQYITSTETLLREFNIQQDIFIKSSSDLSTLFEPLCPALITGICNIKQSMKNNIKSKILGNLKLRTNDDIDNSLINTLFENNISFIMMEFMENYQLLTDLERDQQFRKYKLFSLYELTKLHSYGYKHGDFHNGNVLINSKYHYFTNEENSDLEGRAIIIDFGLSRPIQITNRERVKNIIQYDFPGYLDLTLETEFSDLDSYRNEIAKDFINTIIEKGWDIHNLKQYDLLEFNRSVLRGGLKRRVIKRNSLLKKDKTMSREFKPWWSSPEEEKLAIAELRAALDKQKNDKDYHKKIHNSVLKIVDELGSNENFQKMITGIFTPPVFIGENTETQDELEKLLEEYDEKQDTKYGGNINSNKTKSRRTNKKRNNFIKNKTGKGFNHK